MTVDLFDNLLTADGEKAGATCLAPGALLLHSFARNQAQALLVDFEKVTALAPLRHLVTPGGHTMSVGMSNCGPLGWVSNRSGYRYTALDPLTSQPWPAMPVNWLALAQSAAADAGYPGFRPTACLINQYQPGARLTLHQDRDEKDLTAPIVSVSLGLPAVFQFGSEIRSQRTSRFRLAHGDVVVWGGKSRLAFHGVMPLADGEHPLIGRRRINLTFRLAS